MSDSQSLLERTRAMGLFAEFKDAEVEAFLDLVEPVTVAAGTTIVEQDTAGDSMFVVLSGTAKVIHRNAGRQFELATLQVGDFFGELALVDEGPRSADVVAASDCVLLKLSQAVISALAGVYPSAAFKLLVAVGRVLVRRLRSGNRRYIDSLVVLAGKAD